jgi:Cellulose binding domain
VKVVANGRTTSFNATLRLPSGTGPFPAIIMLNPLAASATSRGYAEVSIDPNSIASDSTSKTGAFWTLYNGSTVDTGVLMAWAWGVHRTLDALNAVPQIDTTKVGVSGYSRYGKAAVVAGAFDQRIALTIPGSSGTAGMGNYRFFFTGGTNDETLDGILGAAYWFTPRFASFRGQANRLPFDQHSVAALIAPRLLLTTNGTEGSDIRTNPQGTSLTYRAAKMVYQYLGAPDRIGINYRPGGHQFDLTDYNAIMDFADKYLRGLPASRTFDNVPYPTSSAAIPWQIPSGNPGPGPEPTAACRVGYDMTTWNSGFTANVAITNTGTSAVNGWTLRFTLPAGQTITGGWNAGYSSTTGAVAAANVSHNALIPPGATVTFGFQATHTSTTTRPSTFTLNDKPCTT